MYAPPTPPSSGPDASMLYRTMEPRPDWPVAREGALIVFSKGVPFPPFCVKCGADASATVRAKLQWHSPWLYLLIVPGVIIYAIAASIVSERAEVALPLCEAHRSRRIKLLTVAWVAALASIATPVATLSLSPTGSSDNGALMCALPLVGMLGALIVGIVGGRIVTPTFIDSRVVKAKGAGPGFLDRCPPSH